MIWVRLVFYVSHFLFQPLRAVCVGECATDTLIWVLTDCRHGTCASVFKNFVLQWVSLHNKLHCLSLVSTFVLIK